MPKIAVQLYTLRDLLQADFKGTLEQVAKVGYEAVELFSYGGYEPERLRHILDELGLQAVSSHVTLERLERELDLVLTESAALGLDYLVCPWLPENRRGGGEPFDNLLTSLTEISERCAASGIQFAYHNHDFEFDKSAEGEFLLDTLFAKTDANHVQAELDLYWIQHAGQDPIEYIQKYSGRCDLLHVKDASKTDGSFAEVGSGTLDWPNIYRAAESAGVKWYIVEQDICPGNPLESIATSLAFLKTPVKH